MQNCEAFKRQLEQQIDHHHVAHRSILIPGYRLTGSVDVDLRYWNMLLAVLITKVIASQNLDAVWKKRTAPSFLRRRTALPHKVINTTTKKLPFSRWKCAFHALFGQLLSVFYQSDPPISEVDNSDWFYLQEQLERIRV